MTDTMEPGPLDDVLDEWLASGEAELFGPPTDMEQADRVAFALRKVQERRAELDAVLDRRIELLRTWHAQQADQLDARAAHLADRLEQWARAVHRDQPGRRTWKLPSGVTVALRKLRARTEADPEVPGEQLVAHIESMVGPGMLPPDAVKVTKSVRLGAVKDATEPGDVIDGYPTPPGYEARQAVGVFDFGSPEPARRVVPGVVLLVPRPDALDFAVKVADQ